MAKEELGTKRVCPETGRKFYDLNKDPIVSPYTGTSYPLSFYEGEKDSPVKPEKSTPAAKAAKVDDDIDAEDDSAELVSLEEADAEVIGDDIPDLDDDDDDSPATPDDTFLADDEEDDDDDIGIVLAVDDDET